MLALESFCSSSDQAETVFPIPKIQFNPKQYICYRTNIPLKIDGKLDENIWQQAEWTNDFVDIERDLKPKPRFRTRAKMLWDNEFFYFVAELEEPDIWATLTERDAVLFYDNDFEIFIDPDGDTHEYYEFEMNAFNTVWDLLLIKPYRDGGPAVNAWDIQGMKTAVFIEGTINQPGDTDRGWTIEVAMP
ncbi:carbohydrate-binding family 9-like protein, partial [candidate division KSB1 bacterium]|nr:carbohydrate-binding family 9-like protein [candidate division KSB1 bacterium]